MHLLPLLFALIAGATCVYFRAPRWLWPAIVLLAIGIGGGLSHAFWMTSLAVLLWAGAFALVFFEGVRRRFVTGPLMKLLAPRLPRLSDTERTALEAGTVGFEGELFSGRPRWNRLFHVPKPSLSTVEQAFLDGPTQELCGLLDDWVITHEHADLPDEIWSFLKRNKFFGLIIPKAYGDSWATSRLR